MCFSILRSKVGVLTVSQNWCRTVYQAKQLNNGHFLGLSNEILWRGSVVEPVQNWLRKSPMGP